MSNIDQILFNNSHSFETFKTAYMYFIYSFKNDIKTLVSYPGGKGKMKQELNEVFHELTKTSNYDTYIDGFYGMGGSLRALSESLIEHGVKTVIANDINPCIIRMHENVRNAKKEMIDYFLKIIREEIVIPYQKLYIHAEEFYQIRKKLIQRFYHLQNKGEFGIETSTLFIMLSTSNFSGTVNFKADGSIYFSDEIFRTNSIDEMYIKTIKKIDTYSDLYNQFDMKFYNADYFKLHKHFKRRPNTIWNIDTVYVKEDYKEYIEEDMLNLKNENIRECKANYGQNNFDHIGVLDSLENINFIYNNNTHPLMYHYLNKFNLDHKLFVRKESISGQKDTEVKEVTEIILYKNNFKESANNIISSKPTQKCA